MTREQFLELCALVADVNGLNVRKQSRTGNLPTIFMSFNGHVAMIELEIYSYGWYPEAEYDKRFEFYFDDLFDEKTYEHTMMMLRAILPKKESPFED